jgi:hypothetical protein
MVSCWSLMAILFRGDSGTIGALLQVQAALFALGLGFMWGGLLRILHPKVDAKSKR